MKRWRKPEPSDVDKALLIWLQQQRSDNVPVSGSFPMTIFFFINFNCKFIYFERKPVWEFIII